MASGFAVKLLWFHLKPKLKLKENDVLFALFATGLMNEIANLQKLRMKRTNFSQFAKNHFFSLRKMIL